MGQFLPADHSKGDANTIGGYTAVHSRPPAFEGKDGSSYSVEVMTDQTGDSANPWGSYLLFVKWRTGDPVALGHLETDFLNFAKSESEARDLTGAIKLSEAVGHLNALIAGTSHETRPWWEVMEDEDGE